MKTVVMAGATVWLALAACGPSGGAGTGQAEQGGYHEIAYLGDDLDLPYGGLSANVETLTARRPLAVATIRALIESVRWLKRQPDGAADLLERYTGTSREIAQRTAERQVPRLSERYEFSPESIRQTLAQQAETTGETIDIPPERAVDYGPLREALGGRPERTAPPAPQ